MKSLVAAALRVAQADPSDVDDYLRQGVTASLASDHEGARAIFEALLPPIAESPTGRQELRAAARCLGSQVALDVRETGNGATIRPSLWVRLVAATRGAYLSQRRQRSPSPEIAGRKHRLSERQADALRSPLLQRFTRSGSQMSGRLRAM